MCSENGMSFRTMDICYGNETINLRQIIRRGSLEEMRKMGIDPYPAAEYKVNAYTTEIKSSFKDEDAPRQVSVAGRIMSRRIMGKASFIELKDSTGRIQVYISRDDLCPGEDKELYNTVFKKLLDIGDFIGIKGFVFRTQMGEITSRTYRFIKIFTSVTDRQNERRRSIRCFRRS